MKSLSQALFNQSTNAIKLLLWLRLLSVGLLSLTALFTSVNLFGGEANDSFFAKLINWPLLSIVIIASAVLGVLNAALMDRMPRDWHLLSTLVLDSLLWFMAISATGGAINPAVSYVLILLIVSALSLNIRDTILLLVVMLLAYAALLEYSPHHHHAMMLSWHLWGMWILFVVNAAMMVWITQYLMKLVRERDAAISEYREHQVKDEKLIALGTLSASIAHELSTPLSTIATLAESIEDEMLSGEGQDASEYADELALIISQVERCKVVIQTLREEPDSNQGGKDVSSEAFVEKIRTEMALLKPAANINWKNEYAYTIKQTSLLEHAVLALINNAVEAASQNVNFHLYVEGESLLIDIEHDGPLLDETLLKQLGKEVVASNKGLGIGYYLANASIEQLGGQLFIVNREGKSVLTRITLPLVPLA